MTAFDLERFATRLHDRAWLVERWRENDRFFEPSDVVVVTVGKPDPAALRRLSAGYTETYGRALPAALHDVLSRFNGIRVGVEPPKRASKEAVIVVDAVAEPSLWPASDDEPYWLESAELFGDDGTFVIGGLFDSGWVALRVPATDDSVEPSVWWIPQAFASAPVAALAPSVGEYLTRWCDAAFCLPVLLRDARVKGWGT